MKKTLAILAFLLFLIPLIAQNKMNTTDKVIQGMLGGLLCALIGLGIRGIISAANKKKDLSQNKKPSLNSNEIIILSAVIGIFVALILGYIFPQHYSFYKGIKVYGKYDYYYLSKVSSEFNYLLALGSFTVVAGVSYLRLMRKTISKKDKVIILSIVIGIVAALFTGYIFSRHYEITRDGLIVYGKKNNEFSEFNYLLAFGSFAVISGISYLRLIKKDVIKKDVRQKDVRQKDEVLEDKNSEVIAGELKNKENSLSGMAQFYYPIN